MRIAVTAFEPFGGRRVNRSAVVLERLAAPAAAAVEKHVLPVAFASLPAAIERVLASRPDALILLGEAGDRRTISVERVALNVIDAGLPDNLGSSPRGTPVVEGGALALPSTFDADAVLAAVRAAGAPVDPSHHAGTFACNAALYLALAAGACPAGFLHVPAHGWPFGPRLSTVVRGVEAVLGALHA